MTPASELHRLSLVQCSFSISWIIYVVCLYVIDLNLKKSREIESVMVCSKKIWVFLYFFVFFSPQQFHKQIQCILIISTHTTSIPFPTLLESIPPPHPLPHFPSPPPSLWVQYILPVCVIYQSMNKLLWATWKLTLSSLANNYQQLLS